MQCIEDSHVYIDFLWCVVGWDRSELCLSVQGIEGVMWLVPTLPQVWVIGSLVPVEVIPLYSSQNSKATAVL